jgi:hypothetical protein
MQLIWTKGWKVIAEQPVQLVQAAAGYQGIEVDRRFTTGITLYLSLKLQVQVSDGTLYR